jgi:hypothetical protein
MSTELPHTLPPHELTQGLASISLFVLCALATWRLTHLVVEEDGPFDLIVRLRAWLGDSHSGRAMDCFYCSSLWLAAPMALLVSSDVQDWAVSWLALSGAACLLHQMTYVPADSKRG